MNLRVVFIIVLLAFLGATFYNFFGEMIPIRNHLGWDGSKFATIASAFKENLLEHNINSYRFKRILPWAIIYSTYKIGDMSYHITSADIVGTMKYANFVLILLTVPMVISMLRSLKVNTHLQVVAFILMYFIFPILKLPYYYPVLTDVPAFFLSVVMLYGYFTRRTWLIVIATLAGIYTFPTLMVSGLALFIFPYTPENTTQAADTHGKYAWVLATFLTVCILLYVFVAGPYIGFDPFKPPYRGLTTINLKLLPLSVIGLLAYLYFIARLALGLNFKNIRRQVFTPRSLIFLGVALAVSIIPVRLFASKVAIPDHTLFTFAYVTFYTALVNPLSSLVSHADYFGLTIALAVLLGGSVLKGFYRLSMGLKLNFLLFLLLGLNSESRQLVALYPFLVITLVLILKDSVEIHGYSSGRKYLSITAMLLAALIVSDFWESINTGSAVSSTAPFPTENYLKHFGPWISNFYYLGHLIMLLASIGLLFFLKRLQKTKIS